MSFGEGEIFELELKNFARAQAVQQHQGHDGQITKVRKLFQKRAIWSAERGITTQRGCRNRKALVTRRCGRP
jgi:hypothetical protein